VIDMMLKLTVLAAALLASVACGTKAGGPPQIELDRSACSHCGMLISETLYAAAYQAPGAEARVFDDIGCLRDAARQETASGLTFWFHDGTHGGWIEGSRAIFVASPEIRTPMGGGLIAYGDQAAADHSAATHHGRVIRSTAELLAKEGS
jgi:copper chaperone NosL